MNIQTMHAPQVNIEATFFSSSSSSLSPSLFPLNNHEETSRKRLPENQEAKESLSPHVNEDSHQSIHESKCNTTSDDIDRDMFNRCNRLRTTKTESTYNLHQLMMSSSSSSSPNMTDTAVASSSSSLLNSTTIEDDGNNDNDNNSDNYIDGFERQQQHHHQHHHQQQQQQHYSSLLTESSFSRESLKRSFGSSIDTLGEIPGGRNDIDSLLVTATMNSTLQRHDKNENENNKNCYYDYHHYHMETIRSTQQQQQYVSNTPSTPSRDHSGNPYGWFSMESMDEKLKESKDIRDANIARTQLHIEHSNSGSSSSNGGSSDNYFDNNNDCYDNSSNFAYNEQSDPSMFWAAAVSSPMDNDTCDELQQISYNEIPEHSILFKWRNPNPSMTLKCSENSLSEKLTDGTSDFTTAVGSTELLISCFIGGYRTVQLSCGSIRAEFQFIFTYGSKSFSCWKPFTEFRKLHRIISHVHKSNYTFPKTMGEWYRLRSRQRWYRCLSVVYLIEKSVLLGRYMQALLMECDSPGLLLYFVQSKAIAQ